MKKILLMGNPNVGKSSIFSRLTDIDVIISNYSGTTVELTKGHFKIGEEKFEVIDIPGTYTLEPISKVEEIAVEMLKEGDILVNVIDSTNLERNLNLTLQLLKQNIPTIIIMNFWDDIKHKGITIDIEKLEKILKVPIVPICAITGEGIKNFIEKLSQSKIGNYQYEEKEKWNEIGNIINSVQKLTHRHHTFLEKLADVSINSTSGIFIAFIVMFFTFKTIRFIGEGFINYVFEPLFKNIWLPIMTNFSQILGSKGFFHNFLIGELIEGKIDFKQSFGVLTTGFFVPIAMIYPYVFAFYFVLGFLEDTGYLPRLAILFDRTMHLVGLHGFSIISILLSFGCKIPGVLSTRVMESKKERFISAALITLCIPCVSQIAMIIGLIGKYGAKGFIFVFGTLFLVWLIIGILLNKTLKGESPEIFVEIPSYRIPHFGTLMKKLLIRIKWFLKEAVPFIFFGIILANILYFFKVIDFLEKIIGPLMTRLFGLPIKAISALIIGFLRKDIAVGMLAPLNLTFKQLIIASIILVMYFPCVGVFVTLVKEFGIKNMMKLTIIMIISTIIVGGLFNLIL
ncbi:MAG: ferrous iron transporter B [bacterium]